MPRLLGKKAGPGLGSISTTSLCGSSGVNDSSLLPHQAHDSQDTKLTMTVTSVRLQPYSFILKSGVIPVAVFPASDSGTEFCLRY